MVYIILQRVMHMEWRMGYWKWGYVTWMNGNMTRPIQSMTLSPAAVVAKASSDRLTPGLRSLMLFKLMMAVERERERVREQSSQRIIAVNIVGLTDNPGRSQVEQNESCGGGGLPIQHTEVVTTLKNVLITKRKMYHTTIGNHRLESQH